jgi:hypothetical protein
MKPPRSALPLPRYVLRKPLKTGWAYFFNIPMWARRAECPVTNEPLGTDYDTAVSRAENVLLPAFDSWRSGASDVMPKVTAVGTLDWVFAEFRADRRFTKLDAKTKRIHESGMRLVGNHVLKNGRRLGGVRLEAIDTSVADRLYERLLFVTETDAAGNTVERGTPHYGQPRDEDLPTSMERRLSTQSEESPDRQSVRGDGTRVVQSRDANCHVQRA